MTTLNDLKGYLDDEAYTVRVGELRALLAEGGKSEAVAYATPEAIGALSRKSAGMFTVYSFPQKWANVPLFTAPQAECARMEFMPVGGNDHMYVHGTREAIDALKERLTHDYRMRVQAERAPRADAEKDVALTDAHVQIIRECFETHAIYALEGKKMYWKQALPFARALLAAADREAQS
jgi:hypothetical protein